MTKKLTLSAVLAIILTGCAHQEDTLNNELWSGDLSMYQLRYSNEPQNTSIQQTYKQPENKESNYKLYLRSDLIGWHIKLGDMTIIF